MVEGGLQVRFAETTEPSGRSGGGGDENNSNNNGLNAAESKCLGMLQSDQPRERKLAGLLLLLHLLKKSTQIEQHGDGEDDKSPHHHSRSWVNSLADTAFKVLDEKFLLELALDPRSLSLVVAVTQTLARLSPVDQVASDPKLWRIAQTGLKTIAINNPMAQKKTTQRNNTMMMMGKPPPPPPPHVAEEEEGNGSKPTEIESLAREKAEGDRRQWNQVAEDTLELALVSLQSSKVVEEGTPECPQYLRDTLDILLTTKNTKKNVNNHHSSSSSEPSSNQNQMSRGSVHSVRLMAIRLLSSGLSRMSSKRKGLTILNLSESGRRRWQRTNRSPTIEAQSSSAESSLVFEDVAAILVSESLLLVDRNHSQQEEDKDVNNKPTLTLSPMEAIRCLGHWLHSDYMVGAQKASSESLSRLTRLGLSLGIEEVGEEGEDLFTWNWLGDLQRGLCSAVKSSVHIQGDCVKIAASLSKALGMTWVLNYSSMNSDSSSSDPMETFQKPDGFAYLMLLTAKTEISLLLSDALQPDARVRQTQQDSFMDMMDTTATSTNTIKAGDRASAHLGDCFVVVEQAIQLVSKAAERGQDDTVEDYFLVLHSLVGVVMDYMVEVSKNNDNDKEDESLSPSSLVLLEEVNLAATRVLGHYFMEVPEFCVSDERLPKIISTMVSLGEGEDELQAYGWTYLAPTLSQICKDCPWAVAVNQEGLNTLLRLTCVLKEGVHPSLGQQSLGKAVLLTNCLGILQEILAHKVRSRDNDLFGSSSYGPTRLLISVLQWSEETVLLLREGCAVEWLELVLCVCDLSLFLLENEKYFQEEGQGVDMNMNMNMNNNHASASASRHYGMYVEAARRQLAEVVKPLYAVFRRTLGEMAEEGRFFAEFMDDLQDGSSDASRIQDWTQMIDFLKYLLQGYLQYEDSSTGK